MASNSKSENSVKKKDTKTTKYYIATNNSLMNEIQELLTDQEIISKKLIEENKDEYILELIFPEEITLKDIKIKFLLIISKDYPNKEPEIYCLTVFSHPHLCDGRNLINNIINGDWNKKKLPLETLINKIPNFIIKQNELIKEDNSINIGKYILKKIYKINFIKELPIFFHLILNKNQILTISDISLCFYDLDKNNVGSCILSSYIDIKDIIEIISKPDKSMIIIKYKNKKTKTIDIITPSYEVIQGILNEKMKIYQKKSGKLPDIDIVKVEQEIEAKEKELNKEESNRDKVTNLMSLYQKAVEYYSAINDQKFAVFTSKIHKLLENSQLSNDSSSIENKDNKNNEVKLSEKENNRVKDKILQKEEMIKEKNNGNNNDKKDSKKDTNKDINVNDIKEENKNKIEEKNENKKYIKEEKINNIDKDKKETNNEDNDAKKDKNQPSIKLKIGEEDLKTLDVGDEEEEEEGD